MRPTRLRGAVVAAAAAVLLGACGSDEPLPTTPPTTSAAPTTTPPSSTPVSGPNRPSPSPTVDPAHPPPYIAGAQWVDTSVGPSLQIEPTRAGRYTTAGAGMASAWAEVLALEPGADTPSMKAQFDCHWVFARAVDPEKPTWNLEPARPAVSGTEMIRARCNPGFAEEE